MPQQRSKGQSFFYGTIILSAAMAIVKVFGFIYKIPIQNMLGATASGYFTTAQSVFSWLYVLFTAGLPVAVSKLVSEFQALGRYRQSRRTLRTALTVFGLLGCAGALILFFGAGLIADWSKQNEAASALRMVAPSMVFVCVIGAYRGYFQGQSNMKPTAVNQMAEAAIKACFGLVLTYIAVKLAAPDHWLAAAAISGVTLSTLFAAVLMILLDRRTGTPALSDRERTQPVLRRLLQISVPITLSAAVVQLSTLIDSTTITSRLIEGAGFTADAAKYYFGSYTFAGSLFNLAPAFIGAVGTSIVPAISKAHARNERTHQVRTIESGLRLTALVAMPAAAGLYFLSWPILNLLYSDPVAVAIADPLLSLLGIASFFTCIVTVTNSMLQAMGMVMMPMITMLLGAIVKLVTSMVLVGRPEINIMGAPIGTLLCYTVIAVPNLLILMRVTGAWRRLLRVFVRPLMAAVIMGLMSKGFYQLFAWLFSLTTGSLAARGPKLALLASIGLSALSYGIMVILFQAITKEDLLLLPKGEKIAKILRIGR